MSRCDTTFTTSWKSSRPLPTHEKRRPHKSWSRCLGNGGLASGRMYRLIRSKTCWLSVQRQNFLPCWQANLIASTAAWISARKGVWYIPERIPLAPESKRLAMQKAQLAKRRCGTVGLRQPPCCLVKISTKDPKPLTTSDDGISQMLEDNQNDLWSLWCGHP